MDVTIESGYSADLVQQLGLGDVVQQAEQRYAALTHLAKDRVRGQAPRLRVTIGTPFIEVIKAVLHDDHDLVLKPVRARPDRALFASNDMHLLRKCPCPVWVEREPAQAGDQTDPPRCQRILASVDAMQLAAKATNQQILDYATAIQQQDAAELDIVHAFQPRFGDLPALNEIKTPNPKIADALALLEQRHAEALKDLAADDRLSMSPNRLHLLHGEPATKILAQAQALKADLMVLATLSRPREPGLFIGTTAEDLLQGAQTSVLALKPEGFVTPVR
jgi:nucleotide-binding universal stress UspA family protein